MSEKNKNYITVILATVFVLFGLLYTFNPGGDFRDAILKIVDLPRSIFSFISDNEDTDKAENSDEIILPDENQPDQRESSSLNPDETPFDSFGESEASETPSYETTSPVGADSTEINELPIHIIDQ